jgi:pimeloyl-ACP methyl ester carboxylesterase
LYQIRGLPESNTHAPDLPGHGKSAGPARDSIGDYSEWLVAFCDALELPKAVIIGHSMGGGIALDFALRFPERVAGLALVATGARLRVAPALLNLIREDAAQAAHLISDWAFGPEAPPEMVRLGRRQMSAVSPQVFYDDFSASDRFDLMDQIQEIGAAAVIICGTHDKLTPPKYSIFLRNHVPNAELHIVEGAGHMVMIEKPQAVLRALRAFLAAL